MVALAATAALASFATWQSARADILTWTGATNSTWDGSSVNWYDTNTSSAAAYSDGSAVQFSDSGPSTTVTVAAVTPSPAGVSPASVEFTHGTGLAGGYTFLDGTGTSGIEGNISLTLDSGYVGTVYLSGQDSITGTATVSGGTLQLTGSAGSTLGTGNIVLNGGNVAFNHSLTAFANNLTANQTTSGLVSPATSDNITFVGTLSSTGGATTSNTVINISGGSTDTQAPLTATNNWAGYVGTLAFGTGQILRMQAIASADTVGSPTALYNLGTNGILEMENNTGVALIGGLSSSSTAAAVNAATHSGTNTNALFVIGGAGLNTTYSGTINGTSSARATVEVTGGGSLTLTNASTYASKTGTAPGYQGAGTTILGNGQEPMAGSLTSFLTASASNGGGALYVSNTTGSATGASPLFIEGASSATNNGNGISGGLLGGDGIIQGEVSTISNTVNNATNSATPLANFAAGGIIAPGRAGTNTSETLTLSGGLQLGDYANLDFSLDTAPATSADALIAVSNTTAGNGQVANSLVLPNDGNIEVNFSFPNGNPALNTPYNLITYTGADSYGSGTSATLASWVPTDVPAGDAVTFNDTGSAITATFAAVPEPASLGLLAVGALGLLRRRRANAN